MKKYKLLLGVGLIALALNGCTLGGNSDGGIEPGGDPVHEHTYSSEWTYDDTYHWHTATCEHIDQVKDKEEHSFGNWIIDKDATEYETGLRHKDCTKCDYSFSEVIQKLEHTHKPGTPVEENRVEPDCTHDGSYDLVTYCTECAEEISREHKIIPATGHQHTATREENRVEPDCTHDGSYDLVTYCTDDNVELSREHKIILALGHNYQSEETHATYEADGFITYTCSRCGDSYTESNGEAQLEHHYSNEWTIDEEKGTHYHACIDPEYDYLRSNEGPHLYDWNIDKEATNFEDGMRTGICSVCGYSVEESIPAIGTLDKLSFSLSTDSTYYVVGAASTDIEGEVVIPSMHNNLPVLNVNYSGFSLCKNMTSIVLPNTIENIGAWAFSGCKGLRSIEIPNGVKSIYERAFVNCTNLISVSIGNGLESIDTDAFNNCSSSIKFYLKFVSLNHYFSISGKNNFASGSVYLLDDDNNVIDDIVISSDITRLPQYAFCRCMLKSLTLPDTMVSIGMDAFLGGGVSNIYFTVSSIQNYFNISGKDYIYGKVHLLDEDGQEIKNISIPESVSTIKSYAFYRCSSIVTVTIPTGITSIGEKAFYNCLSMESIAIPNSVKTIGKYAFQNCSSLPSFVIPESLTSIGSRAFENCYKLVEIINKSSLIIATGSQDNGYVAYYAKQVITDESNSRINTDSAGFVTYMDETDIWLVGYFGNENEITIPNNVTKINQGAFYSCSSIYSIVIPIGVTSIGDYAFQESSTISSITIPNSVSFIGTYAFRGCSSLASITIPSGITSIDKFAFYGCSSMVSISIPNSVTSIGENAFNYCSSLESITIPNNVTSIGLSAFSNCLSLANTYIKVSSIDDYLSLLGKNNLRGDIHLIDDETNEEILNIDITTSLTSIDEYAFYRCSSIVSISIPNSVTSIGNFAFYSCSSIDSIKFEGLIEEWNNITKGNYWNYNVPATVVHCSDGDVNL